MTTPPLPLPDFDGHSPRDCGEHRTVGSHRAWCYDCGEWCYPSDRCVRCEVPQLRSLLAECLPWVFCTKPMSSTNPYGVGGQAITACGACEGCLLAARIERSKNG